MFATQEMIWHPKGHEDAFPFTLGHLCCFLVKHHFALLRLDLA